MPPHDTDFLERWQHPQVRDLAWLLLAPDLLALAWPGRPTRSALGLGELATLRGYLDTLEAYPGDLEAKTGTPGATRLGHYHERLWQHLLETAPNTRLLAHNLPVVRERRTLGELDLLYRNNGERTPVHLEVAIKFYLGLPEGPGEARDQARWVGPGGLDSLAIKRAHLERHQLPMADMPEAQRAMSQRLGEAFGGRLHQRLAMPGVLFYPYRHRMPAPRQAHPAHRHGQWLHWRDWPAMEATLPRQTRGAFLGKPHWLAPPRRDDLIPLAALSAWLETHFNSGGAPRQLVLHDPTHGWRRVFVVDDAWPRQIPLPPEPRALSPR
ncbi:DUF1853 family protein [Halomonas elongata]|uniref:DUF1853 family protein n=1 Tax=Halomonas elongata TaxID=2746 RepID=UPI00186B701C|nr:DUF1853 family protein [Halomonas elongata]MBW5798952.1 DUF1853 family protein [Halomonas elongata]